LASLIANTIAARATINSPRAVEQWGEIAGADSPNGLASSDRFPRSLDLAFELRRINLIQGARDGA
jgi:hypothetical protein